MKKYNNEYYKLIKNEVKILDACEILGIDVRPSGSTYVCKCFNHTDEHPSLHIYPDTNTYHCFQCNMTGDVIEFLKGQKKCEFDDCLGWIEENFPAIRKSAVSQKIDLSINRKVNGYEIAWDVYKKMSDSEEHKLSNFAKKRKFDANMLKSRDVCFVNKRKLSAKFSGDENSYIEKNILEDKFLLKKVPKELHAITQHYEDYFRDDRVMVALKNVKGEIVGFAGRAADDSVKPKYLFTKALKKERILYRLNALHVGSGTSTKELYLVEGIFDVLRLESKKQLAVGVLGSHLSKKQTNLLADFMKGKENRFSICVFMDSDAAGLKGAYDTVCNLLKNSVLRRILIKVRLITSREKDPDEYYKTRDITNKEGIADYPLYEFLFRYLLKTDENSMTDIDVMLELQQRSSEERIHIFNTIMNIMPYSEWKMYLAWGKSVYNDEKETVEGQLRSRVENYVYGNPLEQHSEMYDNIEFTYHMQTALQIARTSYEREDIQLDESTWDRIATSADVFYQYLYQSLRNGQSQRKPLVRMYAPKKLGEFRSKSIYLHEQTLLQQYVLNELLSGGSDLKYEEYIPAVRYSKYTGSRVTGYKYKEVLKNPVSFAYQIDMDVVSGRSNSTDGMFRNFYDCWKEYIEYIQKGVELLENEVIYRVKLDIEGFYDHISRRLIRNALYPCLCEALKTDNHKFKCFQKRSNEYNIDEIAQTTVDWILDELFEEEYYDPKDGTRKQKESDVGIPQGPSLSAYVANISLFGLDKKVQRAVDRINESDSNTIKVRYCRYVDDMVIIASEPEILLQIKDIIATELYDLGLGLSSKTDQEDGVSKSDAIDWTMDEKGGLGVSVGFDLPDDSLDTLFDESEDYQTENRRVTLKLLKSVLNKALYEGNVSVESDFQFFLETVFKTDQIRLNDIIRFSELMLKQAASTEKNIYESFLEIWKQGLQNCIEDSILQSSGLEIYVFLKGCIRVLSRLKHMSSGVGYDSWIDVQEKIRDLFKDDVWETKILSTISNNPFLNINELLLHLELNRIKEFLEITDKVALLAVGKNEYFVRWSWSVLTKFQNKGEIKKLLMNSSVVDKGDLVQAFHWIVLVSGIAKGASEIKEIKSTVCNYFNTLIEHNEESNMLLDSIRIWFSSQNNTKNDKVVNYSLLAFLNILKDELRAETISNIDIYKECMIRENEIILPVFPGIDYPGIMIFQKEKSQENRKDEIVGARRISFVEDDRQQVFEKDKWENVNIDSQSENFINTDLSMNVYQRELQEDNIEYITLDMYVKSEIDENPESVLRIIKDVYPIISECILDAYTKSEYRIVLSKKNVLLRRNMQTNQIEGAEIGISYLIPKEKIGDVVGENKENDSYILRTVDSDGAPFWIAGYIIGDACGCKKYELKKYNTIQENSGYIQDQEMLGYVMKRLQNYGKIKRKNHRKKYHSISAYNQTINRVLEGLGGYLNEKDYRDIYLENFKIVNAFISHRMENQQNRKSDDLLLASWAKNYLCNHHRRLMLIINNNILELNKNRQELLMESVLLKRRVPNWYNQLAEYLYQVSLKNETWQGIRLLAASLWADAILINLRMQTLEIIQALDAQWLQKLLNKDDSLPLGCLGLEDDTCILLEGDYKNILINLFTKKRENNVKLITHLGWVSILGKILEVDKESPSSKLIDMPSWKNIKEILEQIAQMLNCKDIVQEDDEENDENKEHFGYPFKGMKPFLDMWNPDNMQEILFSLNQLDEELGLKVELVDDSYFTLKSKRRDFTIQTKEGILTKPNYFITYSRKINNGLDDIEKSSIQEDFYRYSCTKRRDKILGISLLCGDFGEVLQEWENLKQNIKVNGEDAGLKKFKNKSIKEHDAYNDEIDEEQKNTDGQNTRDTGSINGAGGSEGRGGNDDGYFNGEIRNLQKSWKSRKKIFKNIDRIAIFQFDIQQSSYDPPEFEKYKNGEPKSNEENNPDSCMYPSFIEYRRRKLLESVMEACSIFEVEILLLPEYSVRPETVEWMCKEIERKGYKFSVWAGTFKIPTNYKFFGRHWNNSDSKKLNKKAYWHSSMLPIIFNNIDEKIVNETEKENAIGEVQILSRRFKKYPAVALGEDINPVPAYDQQDHFKPVMKNLGKGNFNDARQDVIEIICAELLVVSNIVNYPSFCKKSYELYIKYKNKGWDDKKYSQWEEKMAEDIQRFGQYTAIYQSKNRFDRTPVVLIPACTTRVVDYYLIGQENYLSAGIKTVLCNASGPRVNGGSCFLGCDSWDDRRIKTDECSNLPREDSIYHGLNPGIYMQTSQDNRGALGDKEQALLICDVDPLQEKTKPNVASKLKSLSLVAHIPILEEQIYDKSDKRCIETGQDSSDTQGNLWEIIEYCKKHNKGGENVYTTTQDVLKEDTEKMKKVLDKLGEKYNSLWLQKRAEYYEKYCKILPQSWPPPALIDWIYVEIDEDEFLRKLEDPEEQSYIYIPQEE